MKIIKYIFMIKIELNILFNKLLIINLLNNEVY